MYTEDSNVILLKNSAFECVLFQYEGQRINQCGNEDPLLKGGRQ